MDALLGKWQVIKEETVGMEEFLKAAGMPQEVIDIYTKLDYTVATSKEGDGYKTHIVMEGVGEQEYTWKFGEEFEYTAIDSTKPKLTITKGENDTIVESYNLADANRQWTVTRSLEGENMKAVTASKNGQMTQKLKRV
ncbi:fatty acid-binding protein, liver-like [Haliotis rufescens]|uniref:fatty acid-binding protein, liver-like n=1 Tax=Haliotis rufescens TaxID=6454 RepID=UPI00201F0C3F|nr:fatty acid-binding protein, liver-like [Haliotis rufescens]